MKAHRVVELYVPLILNLGTRLSGHLPVPAALPRKITPVPIQ
jgi:hypothetical protein